MVKRIGVFVPPGTEMFKELRDLYPAYEFKEILYSGVDRIVHDEHHLPKITEEEHREVLEMLESHEVLVVCQVLIMPFINEIKKTKWIHGIYSGMDTVSPYVNGNTLPPFIFTRSGGCSKLYLSEYLLAQIVIMERQMYFFCEAQKQRKWARNHLSDSKPYRLLSALTITILGVGDIGRTLAYHLKQFGITVYGMVLSIPETKNENVDEFFTSESLTDFLGRSDYVCNVLPKTSKTNSLLSNGVLKHCEQRGSVFVNIGRGNVIRDDEIVEALERKWIRGAVLDVFENEPLREDHKLWNMENVVITPHVAGLATRSETAEAFKRNLELYEAGKPLKYVVDWDKGY